MKKRLLVFSVDALVREDVDTLRTLPNFRKYLGGASEVQRVRTIYPSVTYPAHVSLATGCYPEKHGLWSNFKFATNDKEDTWEWFHDAVKVDDIFTAAKKGGYSTAAVFWPVTGRHPDIDYLVDEYWMPNPGDTLESAFRDVGSSDEVIRIIKENAPLLPPTYVKTGRKNFTTQPFVDNFLIGCTCGIIRRHRPDVTFVHNACIDSARHKTGIFNDDVTKGLKMVDDWFGQLMSAVEDAGVLADTNVVMLSDHGQMNLTRIIKPNVFLADHGLITLSPEGKVLDYKAFCFSNAMSTLVFLKNPEDRKTHDQVYDLLKRMRDEGIYGFTEVFTAREVRDKEHLDGGFSFVLETDGYTSFSDSCVRPVIQNLDLSDFRFGMATHGYLPDKGPQPVFIAKGPGFKKGVVLERRPIVDVAPTLAKLLGVPLPDAQGTAMSELLA